MTKNRRDLTPRHISRFSNARAKQAGTANIKVVIRVRPPNTRESCDNFRMVVKCRELNSLTFDPEEDETPFFFHGVKQKRRDLLKKQNKNIQFTYDRVFPEVSTNAQVFEYTTRDLIDILMDGCNCSVFAYGATGAGKTYTMLGKPEMPGITVLTIGELFLRKEQLSDSRDFELFVTYLEVYNENVRDLLRPSDRPLQLREDAHVGVCVAGLTHKKITNADELFHLLHEGNRNRTQHPTDANAESSRSHAVFQVYLKMVVKNTGQTIIAKLSMIDLAGSERAAATGCKGIRFTEGANINKSLLALGNCINSLADGQKHVPYRDSKLTRILKDSLGGNCHTVMIANVSPSSLSFEDTYNTLKYATRAKKIKANVRKNVVNSTKSSSEYIKIIEGLHEEKLKLKEEVAHRTEEVTRLQEEVTQLKEELECKCKDVRLSNDDKNEVTTSTTDKELIEATFSSEQSVATPSEDVVEEVKQLFATYKKLETDMHSYVIKQKVHERRLALKEEEQNVLFNNVLHATDDHRKRVLELVNRRRRTVPYEGEIKALEGSISQVSEQIDSLARDHPSARQLIHLEHTKIEALKARHDKTICESVMKVQAQELHTRAAFMEHSVRLLQSWHRLLDERGLVTSDMQDIFNKLNVERAVDELAGGDDERAQRKRKMPATAAAAGATATMPPPPPPGVPALEATFIASTAAGGRAKCATAATADFQMFKELQKGSPSTKRLVKGSAPVRASPRVNRQKENKSAELMRVMRRPPVAAASLSRHTPKMLAQAAPRRPFR